MQKMNLCLLVGYWLLCSHALQSVRMRSLISSPVRSAVTVSASYLDDLLEDFMGKRFGAGEVFYGASISSRFKSRQIKQKQTAKSARDASNVVLVVGEADSELTTWTLIELIEKGFDVCLVCADMGLAYKQYGFPAISFSVEDILKFEFNASVCSAVVVCESTKTKWWDLRTGRQTVVDLNQQLLRGVAAVNGKIVIASASTNPNSLAPTEAVESVANVVTVRALRLLIKREKPASAMKLSLLHSRPSGSQERPKVTPLDGGVTAAELAEVAVQALLNPAVANISCLVHADKESTTGALLSGDSAAALIAGTMKRPSRDAFYRQRGGAAAQNPLTVEQVVRERALRELGVLYAVRDPDEVRQQIQEDEAVEAYWAAAFTSIMTTSSAVRCWGISVVWQSRQ